MLKKMIATFMLVGTMVTGYALAQDCCGEKSAYCEQKAPCCATKD